MIDSKKSSTAIFCKMGCALVSDVRMWETKSGKEMIAYFPVLEACKAIFLNLNF